WKPGAFQRDRAGGAEPATGPAAAAAAVPIVYSRCVRTEEPVRVSGSVVKGGERRPATRILKHPDIYDVLPDVSHAFSGFNAPCDLVYRAADGGERVLFDCTARTTARESCAALDAAVSFDGRTVAFATFFGTLYQSRRNVLALLLDPDAENANEQFPVQMPNRYLRTRESRLYLADIETGRVTPLPHAPGHFDAGPAWLSNGRLAFTSTRA